MAIKPPSFNYGSGGGGIMSAAIGAALARNSQQGPSFAQRMYSQKQNQEFLSGQREKEALGDWISKVTMGRMSGEIIDPSTIAGDPRYAGRNIPIREVSGLGLIPGIDEKDLKNWGYTNDQLTVRYADPRAVARAEQQYNPLAERFKTNGPFDPSSLTPEEVSFLNRNQALWDEYIAAPAGEIESAAREAEEIGLTDQAAAIRERAAGTRALSYSDLAGIRSDISADYRLEQRDIALEGVELERRRVGIQARSLELQEEGQSETLGRRLADETAKWSNVYPRGVDAAEIFVKSGFFPKTITMDQDTSANLARMDLEVARAEGDPDEYAIAAQILGSDADPQDIGQLAELYKNYEPASWVQAAATPSLTNRPRTSVSAFDYGYPGWSEAIKGAEAQDIRWSGAESDNIQSLLTQFQNDQGAWDMFMRAFAEGTVPDRAGDMSLTEFSSLLSQNIVGGAGGAYILSYKGTGAMTDGPGIMHMMVNGAREGDVEMVPSPTVLRAFFAIQKARGRDIGLDPEAMERMIHEANVYRTGMMSGASEAQRLRAEDVDQALYDISAGAGIDPDSVRPASGEYAKDEKLTEMYQAGEVGAAVWNTDNHKVMEGASVYTDRAFEFARLHKSLTTNADKAKLYRDTVKAIVQNDYNDNSDDLRDLLLTLRSLTDRGDYAADEQYREMFDELIRHLDNNGSMLDWETNFLDPLATGLWMMEHNTANPVKADKDRRNWVPHEISMVPVRPY